MSNVADFVSVRVTATIVKGTAHPMDIRSPKLRERKEKGKAIPVRGCGGP
jgi:hypothetical protein